MTTQSPDATEQVARAIAEHFVTRFGAKIEEDNRHIGFAMFNPPVPFRVNAANVARAAINALPSNATTSETGKPTIDELPEYKDPPTPELRRLVRLSLEQERRDSPTTNASLVEALALIADGNSWTGFSPAEALKRIREHALATLRASNPQFVEQLEDLSPISNDDGRTARDDERAANPDEEGK